MTKKLLSGIFVSGLCVAVYGCGGGGGGSTPTPTPTPTATPTAAVLTLKTADTPSANYKGLEMLVKLPAGLTVKRDLANPRQTAPGALKISGVFAQYSAQISPRPLFGTYSSSAAGGPERIWISIFSGTANFPVGEFATLNCDLGTVPAVTLTDFSVVSFAAYGTGGTTVTGLSAAPLAVTLK